MYINAYIEVYTYIDICLTSKSQYGIIAECDVLNMYKLHDAT